MKSNRTLVPATIATSTAVLLAGIAVFAQDEAGSRMTFFITSDGPGNGADLGGLAGADAYCQSLAEPMGGGDLAWRAYLSDTGENGIVHARDRIGSGPWHHAEGVLAADSVEHLHSDENNLTKETGLTEGGGIVNGRGDSPNRHDILTGSQPDGTGFEGGDDLTCEGWRAAMTAAPSSATTTAPGEAPVRRRGTRRTRRGGAVSQTWWAREVMGCFTALRSIRRRL